MYFITQFYILFGDADFSDIQITLHMNLNLGVTLKSTVHH